ncbi:SUN domain-containing protein [Entamoeba marina]
MVSWQSFYFGCFVFCALFISIHHTERDGYFFTKLLETIEDSLFAVSTSQSTMPKKIDQPINRMSNYAANDCGAKVLVANEEAAGTNNILNGNRDSYFLSPCEDDIHFVVELCQTIQIHQIGISNFELFSNQFQNLSFSCSVNGTHWLPLGEFTVPNQKILHIIPINSPLWCRYIKIHVTSHYGRDYYCAISSLVVYGISSLDELVDDIVQPDEIKTSTDTIFEPLQPSQQCGIEPTLFDTSFLKGVEMVNEKYGNLTGRIEMALNNTNKTMENSTFSLLQKQKMRLKSVELELDVFRSYMDELTNYLTQQLLAVNSSTLDMTTEVEMLKTINIDSLEIIKNLSLSHNQLEVDNNNQILENQRLSKELMKMKNSFIDLQNMANGKIQTLFYGLLVLTILIFSLITYWICMLSKQYTIAALKAQRHIHNPLSPPLSPRSTVTPTP